MLLRDDANGGDEGDSLPKLLAELVEGAHNVLFPAPVIAEHGAITQSNVSPHLRLHLLLHTLSRSRLSPRRIAPCVYWVSSQTQCLWPNMWVVCTRHFHYIRTEAPSIVFLWPTVWKKKTFSKPWRGNNDSESANKRQIYTLMHRFHKGVPNEPICTGRWVLLTEPLTAPMLYRNSTHRYCEQLLSKTPQT